MAQHKDIMTDIPKIIANREGQQQLLAFA